MKLKSLVCLLLPIAFSASLAQQSREVKLEQLKNRTDVKVTEVEKDILKLEYPNGKVLFKNISDYRPPVTDNLNYSPNYDSTIIDLRYIDTTLYYHKYRFWQEVLIANISPDGVVAGDINNNGRAELYGFVKDYTTGYSDIVLKEINPNGTFDSLYIYKNTNRAVAIYDFNKDGKLQLHLRREEYDTLNNWPVDRQLYFDKETDTSLAFDLSFIFQVPGEGEPQLFHRYYDLEGDELTDVLYINNVKRQMRIYEYNPAINNFDSVYSFDYSDIDAWFEGFPVGDFDQDGKSEFFIGGASGQVYGFESNSVAYLNTWTGQVETHNAFLFAETNDIDGNGKKEFWIGGDSFFSGVPITRLTCFEAVGNNSYQAVARIDIIGFFSFFAFNMLALDLTNNGIDELILCLDQTFIILKFNGSAGHHSYELYYIKQNERALNGENSVYWNASMYDINSDGQKEILITAGLGDQNNSVKFYTTILRRDKPDNIDDYVEHKLSFELFQNYPNPFNPTTTINYSLKTAGEVTLKVYDMLVTEVASLVNERQEAGSYSVTFNAAELPSGIYFYTLSSNNFMATKKLILLK